VTDNRPTLTSRIVGANTGNPDSEGVQRLLAANPADVHWSGPGPTAELTRIYSVRYEVAVESGVRSQRLGRFVSALASREQGPATLLLDVRGPTGRSLALVDEASLHVIIEVLWEVDAAGQMQLVDALS
jgi:hypothetical protein